MATNSNINNRQYDSFALFLDRVGTVIETSQISFLGYSSDGVARRCKQAIYAREWRNYYRNFDLVTEQSQITISIERNTIRVRPWVIWLGTAKFLHHWFRICYSILRTLGSHPNGEWNNRAFTVLQCFGSEYLINREDLFLEFCKSKQIVALDSDTCTLLVYGRFSEGPSENRRFFRSNRALETILRINPPTSTIEFLLLLSLHVRSLISFITTLKSFPLICLMYEDFSLHALMEYLNRRNLISWWIIDNSAVLQQPLPLTNLLGRKFKTGIVFYSINNRVHVLNDKYCEAVLLCWRYLALDIGWAWNLDQAEWLRNNSRISSILVTGPMLYRLPPTSHAINPKQSLTFDILIFDNTIASAEHYAELYGKHSPQYPDGKMAISFLDDIVESVAAARRVGSAYEIRMRLKVKRLRLTKTTVWQALLPYQNRNSRDNLDSDYQTIVSKYLSSGTFGNVEAGADLYALLGACNLVISIPYTSINFMADQIGVPSVYYDPTGRLVNIFAMQKNMQFVQGYSALVQYLRTALADWASVHSQLSMLP